MGVILTTPRPTHGSLNWDTTIESDLAALASAINTPVDVSGTSLNSITRSGWYSGNNLTNSPDGTTASFTVVVMYASTTFASQLAVRNADGAMFRRTLGAGPAWSAWGQVVDSTSDTGWVTSGTGITAGSGFTLNGSKYRIRNGVVSIAFSVTKAASALGASSTGVIAQTTLVNLPAGLTPSNSGGAFQAGGASATALAFGYFSSAGTAVACLATPTTGLPASCVLDCQGTFSL